MRAVVHLKYFAHNIGITALVTLPILVAEHQHGVSALGLIGRYECSAQQRLGSEDVKEVCGNNPSLDPLCAVLSQKEEGHAVILDYGLQGMVVIAIVENLFGRERHVIELRFGRLLLQNHKLRSVRVRQGTQQHAVDNAEDRSIRADTEGKREHYQRREPWIVNDHPPAEAEILQEALGPCPGTHFTHVLLHLVGSAELDLGRAESLLAAHAGRHLFIRQQCYIRRHFLIELFVYVFPTKQVAKKAADLCKRHEC